MSAFSTGIATGSASGTWVMLKRRNIRWRSKGIYLSIHPFRVDFDVLFCLGSSLRSLVWGLMKGSIDMKQ